MGFLKWLSLVPTLALSVEAVFTPEKLISAPLRDEAVPNNSGKLALYQISQYSFETHSSTDTFNILDTATGKTFVLTNDSDVSGMVWVDDTTVIYLNTSNSAILGGVELWLASIADFKSGYKAASIPVPLENLKIAVTKSGDINFLLTGKAWANGTAYNENLAATPLSSARIYDSLYVRHWDTYVTRQKSTLFSGVLKGNTKKTFNGKLTNLLTGTKNLETPIPPFGDVWNFDIAQDGQMVAFMSKAPELPQANYTAAYIYLVPFDGSAVARALNGPTSMAAKRYPKALGASQSPTFAPDGRTLAYFQMDGISYESDRNKLYIADLATGDIRGVAHNWDRSPFGITYSKDGKTIWLAAEEHARSKIFTISASAGEVATPIAISHEGYVTASYQIGPNTLLASNTSLLQSYGYSIVDMHGKNPPKVLLDPRVVDPELEGLTDSQVEEFWFKGNWTDIQGWIIKPADFDPKKKYPLAMLFHGGPQGSWANVWSSRWSPAAWAAQGYIIVAINPTGSFGFGQKLTDAVQNNWGGAPYYDIILGFKHIAANYPYIDTKNAVAAGASFGGYMVNWIAGHDFGRKFKALVSHDGVYSTLEHYGSDELFFIQRDFNGTLWNNRENYERYDPARFAINWATPMLVIHNDLDYRLPISGGIALFNILQERGVPSKFLNFPDENHWVLKPENSLVWHYEVFKWINKYTGVKGTV